MLKRFLKRLLGRRLTYICKVIIHGIPEQRHCRFFDYDCQRFYLYSGLAHPDSRFRMETKIITLYHVLEKGLTMPNRKTTFGVDIADCLVKTIDEYEAKFGLISQQINHAIGVLKEYYLLRKEQSANVLNDEKWERLVGFCANHGNVPAAQQIQTTKKAFYAAKNAAFPEFSRARHTLRHYAQVPLSLERLQKAVDLAQTTPTACNRQYCRTYCISDKSTMARLLEIQQGNRGFGHLADKLLIVTADLEGMSEPRERNDLFTNGGMYLMNLCYSLFYFEIAHCVLNWSRTPEEDLSARELLPIKPSETIIAILTCGETPERFDVAASPRNPAAKL